MDKEPQKSLPRFAKTKDGKIVSWKHSGGKLWRLGPEALTDAELLAIVIGTGSRGQTAQKIAEEVLHRFQSFRGMSGQTMDEYLKIKGIDRVKCTRLAAVWEIARRIVHMVIEDREKHAE